MPIPPTIFETVAQGVIGLSRSGALAKLGDTVLHAGRPAAQAAGQIASAIKSSPSVKIVTQKVIAIARVAHK